MHFCYSRVAWYYPKESAMKAKYLEMLVKNSNREKFRFEVMQHLDGQCKSKRLGVSLKTNKCFSTPNHENPINFWHYLPQHDSDRAPIRINCKNRENPPLHPKTP